MGSCSGSITSSYITNMKFLVLASALVSMCLCEADAHAQNVDEGTLPLEAQGLYGYNPFFGLPEAVGAGAVSSTNVNVPGKFSYVVNSVHPTKAEQVAPVGPLSPLSPVPSAPVAAPEVDTASVVPALRYNFPINNGYYGLGLGYNGYNQWAGAGYLGLNGLNAPLAYGGLGRFGRFGGYPYYG